MPLIDVDESLFKHDMRQDIFFKHDMRQDKFHRMKANYMSVGLLVSPVNLD